MPNQRVMFKVCKNGKSAVSVANMEVSYKLGGLTKPNPKNNDFLFVFGTEKQARSFITLNFTSTPDLKAAEIYKVLAFDVTRHAKTYHGDIIEFADFPRGTHFCKSLYLLEKLK